MANLNKENASVAFVRFKSRVDFQLCPQVSHLTKWKVMYNIWSGLRTVQKTFSKHLLKLCTCRNMLFITIFRLMLKKVESWNFAKFSGSGSGIQKKQCQRHNWPEGWVHITSSITNLDHISSSESRPSINFIISSKHQPFHKTRESWQTS